MFFKAKDALLQAHDQIKKLHITVEELKLWLTAETEQNTKNKKEYQALLEQHEAEAATQGVKERALLDKIKLTELELAESRGSCSSLKRFF